jgi:putative phosphoribosyl transferase
MSRFADRAAAGRILASKLLHYSKRLDVVVLALPRGGVPVGYEVARALRAPLDVFIVRKLGVPGHEELAMGAIASGGVRVINTDVTEPLRIPTKIIERVEASEKQELERRERLYRRDREPLAVDHCTVILVDDGLATGSTMRAAAIAVRKRHPGRVVVAVPVAARGSCEEFRLEVEETVCAFTPQPFHGVGMWYENFTQVEDDEVRDLLEKARHGWGAAMAEG